MTEPFILMFSEIGIADLSRVGEKTLRWGDLFGTLRPKGEGVLDGFAITTDAYWRLLKENGLRKKLELALANLDCENLAQLATAGHAARSNILGTPLPSDLRLSI
jgi:pyruvate,water dikinase